MYDKVYRAFWHGSKPPGPKEIVAETTEITWTKRDLNFCRRLQDNEVNHFKCHELLIPEKEKHESVKARLASSEHEGKVLSEVGEQVHEDRNQL